MNKFTCFDHQDNEDRRRCYGLRIGDIVRIYSKDHLDFTTEVVGLEALADNNSVYVIWKDGTIRAYIAEYCDIVTKVEDRDKDSVHCLELIINKAFKKLIDTPNWYKSSAFECFNYDWIYGLVIKPYEEGTCYIEKMVSWLAKSQMQIADPKKA